MEAIEKKVDGQEVSTAPAETPQAQVIDLMEALKASLARRDDERRDEATSEASRAADAPITVAAHASERRPAKKAPRRAAASRAKAAK